MKDAEVRANVATTLDDDRFSGILADDMAVVLSFTPGDRAARTRSGNYGVARVSMLVDYGEIARNAGLRLEAVDYEGFAWKRAIGGRAHGVLVVERDTASLVVFTPTLFHAQSFDRTGGADWIDQIGDTIRRLRIESNQVIDPRTIAYFSEDRDLRTIDAIENSANISLEFWRLDDPMTGVEVESPAWALAYGIALYTPEAEAIYA
jgi:hypothetical protein